MSPRLTSAVLPSANGNRSARAWRQKGITLARYSSLIRLSTCPPAMPSSRSASPTSGSFTGGGSPAAAEASLSACTRTWLAWAGVGATPPGGRAR